MSENQITSKSSVKQQTYYDVFYARTDFVHFHQDLKYTSYLASLLPNGGTILDVGCGTGYYTSLFATTGLQSVGLDVSLTGLLRGKSPNVHLVQGDACRLPFRDGSFDMVFCRGFTLLDRDDILECVAIGEEQFRCLAKDGLFVFAWSTNLRGGERKRGWHEHTKHTIMSYLSKLNGKVVKVSYVDRKFFLRFLGRMAFHPLVGFFVSWAARITGFPCDMVVVLRKL